MSNIWYNLATCFFGVFLACYEFSSNHEMTKLRHIRNGVKTQTKIIQCIVNYSQSDSCVFEYASQTHHTRVRTLFFYSVLLSFFSSFLSSSLFIPSGQVLSTLFQYRLNSSRITAFPQLFLTRSDPLRFQHRGT